MKKKSDQKNRSKRYQIKKLKSKVTAMLELPKEIVLNLPHISIIGSEEINIENYKGVIEYTEQLIRINTSSGILRLTGKKLCIRQITDENIKITGVLGALEYLL